MILQKDDKSGWNAWQAFLVTQGFTGLVCDGIPGPATERATRSFQLTNHLDADGVVGDATLAAAKAVGFGGLDAGQTDTPVIITQKPVVTPSDEHLAMFGGDRINQINETVFAQLAPPAQVRGRAFVAAAGADGTILQAVQGLRTFSQQTKLWLQGREGNPGPVVTDAKAGQSLHNYGCAIDFAPVVNGVVSWDDKLFAPYGKWAEAAGLEWGGSWKHFKDLPHVQWTNGMSLAMIQRLYAAGGLGEVWKRLG